jgi:phenylalanyl-tRNA synthetase beta chain
LLLNIKHNIANSYQKDICLFEIANVFIGDKNDLSQSNFLSGIVAKGKVGSWTNKTKCEFYWLKEFISNTLNSLGIGGLIFKDGENKSFYHPSQCAKILSKGEEVATMGFIHPVILQKLKITTQVIYFEINIEKLFSALKKSRCNNSLEISKMPLINRDFSFIAKVDFPYSKLEAMLKKTGGRNLQEIILFDVYSGKPLESDEKSFAIRCVWQDKKKTLSDEDINSYVACILERAKKEGLVLRDS